MTCGRYSTQLRNNNRIAIREIRWVISLYIKSYFESLGVEGFKNSKLWTGFRVTYVERNLWEHPQLSADLEMESIIVQSLDFLPAW